MRKFRIDFGWHPVKCEYLQHYVQVAKDAEEAVSEFFGTHPTEEAFQVVDCGPVTEPRGMDVC